MAEFRRKTIGIAVVEHQGCYLVGIRPAGASLAGFAEFPGGKCEPGEEPSLAAVRECREETGLHVQMVELLTRRLYEYAYGAVDLHFYLCRPTDPLEPHTDLRGFRWENVAALRALKFPDANVPVLDLLEQRARDHGT
jgi:8-oxo-dGTP diphosphatase